MAKLREQLIGQKIWIKDLGRLVEVNEKNVPILKAFGRSECFVGKDELKPIKDEKSGTVEKTENDASERSQNFDMSVSELRTELRKSSENDFEGRSVKEVKEDFDKIGVKYPKNAGLKRLAKIIQEEG